jgi:SAM-dependent methyltransferase
MNSKSGSDSPLAVTAESVISDINQTLLHYEGMVEESSQEQAENLDRALYHQLLQAIPPSMPNYDPRILDAGCGTGEWLEAFTRLGLHGEGVDASQAAVDVASQKGLQVEKKDLRLWSPRKEFYDAVWCLRTFSHFPLEDLQRILGSFFQGLRPRQGVLVCDFFEGEGIRYEDRSLVTRYHGMQAGTDLPPRIWYGFREEAFLALTRQSGFAPTHRAEKPRDASSGLKSVLYFMKRA